MSQSSTKSDAPTMRTLTELDHVRINNLMRRQPLSPQTEAAMEDVLDVADLVASQEVAPDVVTMQSKVLVRYVATGEERTLTLGYPADADAATGCVSVLSPVGASLLGLSVGQVAHWASPDGRADAAEIKAILFQPEASGDFTA